jgi:hypothetical protein
VKTAPKKSAFDDLMRKVIQVKPVKSAKTSKPKRKK